MFDIGAIWHRRGEPLDSQVLVRFGCAIEGSYSVNMAQPRGSWALLSSEEALVNATHSKDLAVVADCHLHNKLKLINQLGVRPPTGSVSGSNALLREAYLCWGDKFVEHLLGDFAVCIFDVCRQHLFVARDRLGNKPLYYAEYHDHLLVSSQIKPILDCGLIPHDIYQPRLADHIVLRSESAEPTRTFYQQIYRVPPAHSIVFKPAAKKQSRYWVLTPPKLLKLKSAGEYSEAFLHELTAAVNRSIDDSSNIAHMLSGGLDSSGICAVAANQSPITTLSASSDHADREDCIESRSSQQVAGHLNSNHYNTTPTDYADSIGSLSNEFRQSTNMFDSLMMNSSLAVMKLAKSHSVKVLTDGLDGGMIAGFSGGSCLQFYLTSKQYELARSEVKRLCSIHQIDQFSALWQFALRGLIKGFAPQLIVSHIQQKRERKYYQEYLSVSGINPNFAKSVGLLDRLLEVERGLIGNSRLSHAEQHAQRVQHPSLLMAIERYERLARVHGVEARHPLLDISFVEFCLSLPAEMKNNTRFSKPLMRDALRSLLPENIVHRPYMPIDHLAPKYRIAWQSANSNIRQKVVDNIDLLSPYFDNPREFFEKDCTDQFGLLWSISSFMLWQMK